MKKLSMIAVAVLAISCMIVTVSYAQTGTTSQGTTSGTYSGSQKGESTGSSGVPASSGLSDTPSSNPVAPGTSQGTSQAPAASGTPGTYSGSQSTMPQGKAGEAQKRMGRAGEMPSRATKIVGMVVEDSQGQRIGKVEDLIIDPQSDRVLFAVVEYGGTLGVGGKYTAVPLSVFSEGNRDRLVLNINKDKLASAPTFDKNQWPDVRDRAWSENVYRYYGQTPYWQQSGEKERKQY